MNIKIGILNVPKHDNKHDLIHFVTSGETAQMFYDVETNLIWIIALILSFLAFILFRSGHDTVFIYRSLVMRKPA